MPHPSLCPKNLSGHVPLDTIIFESVVPSHMSDKAWSLLFETRLITGPRRTLTPHPAPLNQPPTQTPQKEKKFQPVQQSDDEVLQLEWSWSSAHLENDSQ